MIRTFICFALIFGLSLSSFAADKTKVLPVRKPVRLESGEPMVCIYYFTHWWEPWKSNDERILEDFMQLKQAGFNTILLDSECSQAMPGEFELLDRGHRLAKQAGLQIVPWLSLKTYSDMTGEARWEYSEEKYGASVTVTDNGFLPYGDGTIDFGVKYAEDYLERYKDQALLHVKKGDKLCPVISLSAEASWLWTSSLDSETRMLFARWLRRKYESVDSLNSIWRTKFKSFFEVDPSDADLFDYASAASADRRLIPQPVMDHIRFRAGIVSDAMNMIKARLKEKYPNLIILAEVPYPFADEHPHAWGYTVGHASVSSMVKYADIVVLRGGGRLTQKSRDAIADYVDGMGKQVVVCHRISPGQGPGKALKEGMKNIAGTYATEAAGYFNGIGYYSWNEMVDVHMVPNEGTSAPDNAPCIVTATQFKALYGLVTEINQQYQQIYKDGLKEVSVPPALVEEQGLRTIY